MRQCPWIFAVATLLEGYNKDWEGNREAEISRMASPNARGRIWTRGAIFLSQTSKPLRLLPNIPEGKTKLDS